MGAVPFLGASQSERNLIKAGFITKFPEFIRWPEVVGDRARGAIRLCALGDQGLIPFLPRVAKHTRVRGLAISFQRISGVQQASDCQILYIAPSQDHRLESILRRVAGWPLLTVADSPGFAHRGVMINLVDDDRVRFEINRRSVAESPLRFSFRLLEIGEILE
jgi:hypothetical protein